MSDKIKHSIQGRLRDKRIYQFIILCAIAGLIAPLIFSVTWNMISGYSLLSGLQRFISDCWGNGTIWGFGGFMAWIILPVERWKWLWWVVYLLSILVFALIPFIGGLYFGSSIVAWVVLFTMGNVVVSIPSAIFLRVMTKRMFVERE